jgi:hypothetical protein
MLLVVLVGPVLSGTGLSGATPGGPLSDSAQSELAGMPIGSKVISCSPDFDKFPVGTRTSRIAGFDQIRAGLRVLSDGHCAQDPNATPAPLREDYVDRRSGT